MTAPQDPAAGGPDPQYGAPPPGYGAPPPGYGAPPPGYGQPYGPPPMGGPLPPLANWGQRVLAALIDYVAPFVVGAVLIGAGHGLQILGYLIYLVALAWALYNAYLGGQTGQSHGKRIVGLRLIGEQTGQPIGGGLGIGRYFLHIVDGLVCYLGYLWPLWDSKRQTFSDKLVHTVVLKV